MFIVMFSSPSKYLVFRKKNKLTASVQSGFYEAVSTGIASAGPGNRAIGQTLYILVRVQVNRVKINQNFMKWNLTPLIKCIWYNIYISINSPQFIHHQKKWSIICPPQKKKTSGHIFWNQMSRTMLGWRLDELFVHPSIITSPSAPPRQPPMSAAPLRVYPRDKCKDCECKGCVNQVVFSVWTYHPPTLKLKLVELENLNYPLLLLVSLWKQMVVILFSQQNSQVRRCEKMLAVDVSLCSPDAPGALEGGGPLTGRLWEQTAAKENQLQV